MNALAVDWTAVGSIAGGLGAIAAFLAILATVAVYLFQSRGDKAAAIRRNLHFIHSQQLQVLPSLESGILAMIDRQIRGFRERLGPAAEPGHLLDQLFGTGQVPRDRPLFRASALDSNLSSEAYAHMSGIWGGMSMRASEFRGSLRVFSYICEALANEASRLCDPVFTTGILDAMAERGDLGGLSRIDSLDELVNELLAAQIELAQGQFAAGQKAKIGQGCFLAGMLADTILRLSDGDLLKLARKNIQQPTIEEMKTDPCQAIDVLMGHLAMKLPKRDLDVLRDVLHRWNPQPEEPRPAGLTRSEEAHLGSAERLNVSP